MGLIRFFTLGVAILLSWCHRPNHQNGFLVGAADAAEDSEPNVKQCSLNDDDDESCIAPEAEKQESNEAKQEENDDNNVSECGIWLAMSTLPGAGIGMYAGKDFNRGDNMHPNLGDHCIPITDLELNHNDAEFFLWDEYTWNSQFLRMNNQGRQEVNVASAGFGAAANSFMDFLNVNEGIPRNSIPQNLDRRKDPGAGAFTTYHSRRSTAKTNIKAGQELFVSYGNDWFTGRDYMGPIPISGSHMKAERLLNQYKLLRQKKHINQQYLEILEEVWDTFVANNTFASRVIAALPTKEDIDEVKKHGSLTNLKRSRMVRSNDWLAENGCCADNFYMNESTIPQAGNGAFARRFLKEGTAVLPVPLIHIPERSLMEMYHGIKNPSNANDEGDKKDNRKTEVRGYQLMLNYCLGHRDSTVLLSPYGPAFNLVNHNQTQANVRLQWAFPQRSQLDPELLKKNVTELEDVKSSRLAMELVAIRDIHPDEEIFLNYGDEWEKAWLDHVQNWKPVEGAKEYTSSFEMDARSESLRTEFEQMKNPYPSNLRLKFDRGFEYPKWRKLLKEGGDLIEYRENEEKYLTNCEIMRRREVNGRVLYTAVISKDDDDEEEKEESKLVEDVPREAFLFVDRPYTADIFLSNAFRHDIRIPDDIFPESWKNNIVKKEESSL